MSLPFVFVALAFLIHKIALESSVVGQQGLLLSGRTNSVDLCPVAQMLQVPKWEPVTAAVNAAFATHPSQETALISRAALPDAAHAGSLEPGSPGFSNQLQVVLPWGGVVY